MRINRQWTILMASSLALLLLLAIGVQAHESKESEKNAFKESEKIDNVQSKKDKGQEQVVGETPLKAGNAQSNKDNGQFSQVDGGTPLKGDDSQSQIIDDSKVGNKTYCKKFSDHIKAHPWCYGLGGPIVGLVLWFGGGKIKDLFWHETVTSTETTINGTSTTDKFVDDESPWNTSVIVGLVMVAIILIGAVVCYCRKHQKPAANSATERDLEKGDQQDNKQETSRTRQAATATSPSSTPGTTETVSTGGSVKNSSIAKSSMATPRVASAQSGQSKSKKVQTTATKREKSSSVSSSLNLSSFRDSNMSVISKGGTSSIGGSTLSNHNQESSIGGSNAGSVISTLSGTSAVGSSKHSKLSTAPSSGMSCVSGAQGSSIPSTTSSFGGPSHAAGSSHGGGSYISGMESTALDSKVNSVHSGKKTKTSPQSQKKSQKKSPK